MTAASSATEPGIPEWINEIGIPPERIVRALNPDYNSWLEKCALHLCVDAGEAGVIPTPCVDHFVEATRIAFHLHVRTL